MGAGIHSGFGKTEGARTIMKTTTKRNALKSVSLLPKEIQRSAKRFFKKGSNEYNSFDIKKHNNGNYIITMIKPGNVPGSKAYYYKIVDKYGKTVRTYKKTYDPKGILVHTKEK